MALSVGISVRVSQPPFTCWEEVVLGSHTTVARWSMPETSGG